MNMPTASITEIAPNIHRISVAMPPEFIPGGFSFNQYLLIDEKPLLFHTGPRKLFPLVRAQIEKVLPNRTVAIHRLFARRGRRVRRASRVLGRCAERAARV